MTRFAGGVLVGCLIIAACSDDEPAQMTSASLPAHDTRGNAAVDLGGFGDADASAEDTSDVARPSEAEAAAMRAACAFDRGALAEETVGLEFPVGDDIPIDHFLVLMQENRSFDHYFGTMPGIDGFPEGAGNPRANGEPVAPYHETAYCIRDVRHSWNASHIEWNFGDNDGFVIANDPGGERAMGYYDDTDLPFYWDLYQTFAMSDHHHCSVLGPTWVNRWYFLSGTSFGQISNQPGVPMERFEREPYNLYQLLDEAEVEWRVYFTDVPWSVGGYPGYSAQNRTRFFYTEQLFEDLESGDLPPVVYVDPSFVHGVEQTDEHPPADMQFGQRFVSELVNALMESPLWSRSALILTYDEHGGYYDHVPPPEACDPGDYPPDLGGGDFEADFDRLGFRVPLAVISPYARAGYVSDRVTDLTSVLRLVEARFGLPALTPRDANAWPLLDMFDFDDPPFVDPPELAEAAIDEERLEACHTAFGN